MDPVLTSAPGDDRWEIGSEYHFIGAQAGPYERIPEDVAYFGLAQHGVIGLWRWLTAQGPTPTLWVPDYYCLPVLEAWERAEIPMRTYRDDPTQAAPGWETLDAGEDDLVLAVNYFGMRSPEPWSLWTADHSDIRVVEDHSHDPFSTWARTSTAPYAVASLRKTIPVPDGGMVWSPRGLPLPPPGRSRDRTGSALKLAAMIRKTDYLAGAPTSKDRFRDLQTLGESTLLASDDLEITPWSMASLADGVPVEWRRRRARNVRAFLAGTEQDPRFRAIWSDGGQRDDLCPFNVVLLFERSSDRDAVRGALADARVFTAIHWPQSERASARIRDVSDRILTIPLDLRYGGSDVARVVDVVAGTR